MSMEKTRNDAPVPAPEQAAESQSSPLFASASLCVAIIAMVLWIVPVPEALEAPGPEEASKESFSLREALDGISIEYDSGAEDAPAVTEEEGGPPGSENDEPAERKKGFFARAKDWAGDKLGRDKKEPAVPEEAPLPSEEDSPEPKKRDKREPKPSGGLKISWNVSEQPESEGLPPVRFSKPVAALIGLGALVLAAVGWIRGEDKRAAWPATCFAVGAIAFEYVVLAIAAAVFLVVLLIILSSLATAAA